MKALRLLSTAFICVLLLTCALSASEVSVILDEKPLAFTSPAMLYDNRTHVQAQTLFSAANCLVLADGDSISAWKGENAFIFNENGLFQNGKLVSGTEPTNGLLPLRAAAEAMGMRVNWCAKTLTATLTTPRGQRTYETIINGSAVYPYFEGETAVNAQIEAFVADYCQRSDLRLTFEITCNRKNYLSMLFYEHRASGIRRHAMSFDMASDGKLLAISDVLCADMLETMPLSEDSAWHLTCDGVKIFDDKRGISAELPYQSGVLLIDLSGAGLKTLTASLEGNSTTGYLWQSELPEELVSAVYEYELTKPSDGGIMSVGGISRFHITGLSEGYGELIFRYLRPWQADSVQKTITYCIYVEADHTITLLDIRES